MTGAENPSYANADNVLEILDKASIINEQLGRGELLELSLLATLINITSWAALVSAANLIGSAGSVQLIARWTEYVADQRQMYVIAEQFGEWNEIRIPEIVAFLDKLIDELTICDKPTAHAALIQTELTLLEIRLVGTIISELAYGASYLSNTEGILAARNLLTSGVIFLALPLLYSTPDSRARWTRFRTITEMNGMMLVSPAATSMMSLSDIRVLVALMRPGTT